MAKPHWFRFSLRTLFVLVTLLCVWLGWNLKIVRERKAIIAEINRVAASERHDPTAWYPNQGLESWWASHDQPVDWDGFEYARVSKLRLLLGDDSYWAVFIPSSLAPEVVARAEHAFPEAELHVIDHKLEEQQMVRSEIVYPGRIASRDSLYKPAELRLPNTGGIFKSGLMEK